MRIAETTYRECCQLEDLTTEKKGKGRILRNLRMTEPMPERMWCRHCDAEHEYYTFTDAAGSGDWNYRKVKKAKKK